MNALACEFASSAFLSSVLVNHERAGVRPREWLCLPVDFRLSLQYLLGSARRRCHVRGKGKAHFDFAVAVLTLTFFPA
jgi:hypothetical protein